MRLNTVCIDTPVARLSAWALPDSGIKVGEKAPDFSLPNAFGKTVSLSEQLQEGQQAIRLLVMINARSGSPSGVDPSLFRMPWREYEIWYTFFEDRPGAKGAASRSSHCYRRTCRQRPR